MVMRSLTLVMDVLLQLFSFVKKVHNIASDCKYLNFIDSTEQRVLF